MINSETLRQAIDQAKSGWRGCDWQTEFGPREINLRGLRSRQAILAAKATRGEESKCWQDAARWLTEVETAADQAARFADQALVAVAANDFKTATRCLEVAMEIESKFGRGNGYQRAKIACEQCMPFQSLDS